MGWVLYSSHCVATVFSLYHCCDSHNIGHLILIKVTSLLWCQSMLFHACSSRIATRQECSAGGARDSWTLPEVTRNLPQSTNTTWVRSTTQDLWLVGCFGVSLITVPGHVWLWCHLSSVVNGWTSLLGYLDWYVMLVSGWQWECWF